jgi:A/G-specific adenine glycosylase
LLTPEQTVDSALVSDDLDALRGALLLWYARERRDLPWRRTTDPYAILVSEVMLQQTQVARVVPRYLEWLARWPDVTALAAASRAEVLGAWVGLGYNRRALALHAAAVAVARDGWPADLRSLPGVGPYTAAAVGSFAFGRRELAIDTNARRVFARWGFRPDEGSAPLNQAVMELGATLCRAHEARCGECPVAGCGSRGVPVVRPARAAATVRVRFEDSDRYARGRVLAALAGREPWPEGLGDDRIERAMAGLERDGMVIRDAAGARLP